MKCWNCGKPLPPGARACQFCEAPVEQAPTAEEMDAVQSMLGMMDPATREQMMNLAKECDSAEEFVRQILTGDCPRCGSAQTEDCMNDPELENPCIGRCLECGYLWCSECGQTLDPKSPYCPCWNVTAEEDAGEDDDTADDDSADEDDGKK